MKNLTYFLLGILSMVLLSATPAYNYVVNRPLAPTKFLTKTFSGGNGSAMYEAESYIRTNLNNGYTLNSMSSVSPGYNSYVVVVMEKY